MRARSERLHRRNLTQLAVDNGQINDPDFLRALKKAEDGVDIEDLGGDYYEPSYSPQGAKTGRVFLKPVEKSHGMDTSPATYQAMIAGEDLARTGVSRVAPPEKDLEAIAAFLQEHVMPTSYNGIGILGSRETPTDNQKLYRAAALLGDVERGYDARTGMPFNTMKGDGIVGIDAGHLVAHTSRPDLSNEPSNIGFQNKYENRGQSAAEKMAGAQGREATGEEIADMLFKSIMNRSVADVRLPRKGSQAYKEMFENINAKVMPRRMAGDRMIGSSRIDSPGDNADRTAYLDSDGGPIHLHLHNGGL